MPETAHLHNATSGQVKVWQNVDGFNDMVAELKPGESRTVLWIY